VRGARGFLIPAGISATIFFLGACHKDVKSGGAVPIDTAAVMPTLDTTPALDSSALADSTADSTAIDSLSASLPPDVPSTIAVADSVAGDGLFHGKGRCFTCHGERGQGTPRLGPSLTDSEWLAGNGSLAAIEYVITHGVAVPKASSVAMPAYSGMLSAREIEVTAAYVYALAHPGSTAVDSLTRGTSAISTAAGEVR
jgi:mono/diheme cytochrome c family protein